MSQLGKAGLSHFETLVIPGLMGQIAGCHLHSSGNQCHILAAFAPGIQFVR